MPRPRQRRPSPRASFVRPRRRTKATESRNAVVAARRRPEQDEVGRARRPTLRRLSRQEPRANRPRPRARANSRSAPASAALSRGRTSLPDSQPGWSWTRWARRPAQEARPPNILVSPSPATPRALGIVDSGKTRISSRRLRRADRGKPVRRIASPRRFADFGEAARPMRNSRANGRETDEPRRRRFFAGDAARFSAHGNSFRMSWAFWLAIDSD
jgi:hypothetical protein